MARPKDDVAHARRREAFLDATQNLIQTTGYETMTIAHVLEATGASKGAFYHYFGSKQDLLEALLERTREQLIAALQPLIADESLSGQQKLRGFAAQIAAWKSQRHDAMLAATRAWYRHDNAMPRQKLREANVDQLTPVMGAILRQCVHEKLCDIANPELVARMALVLMYDMKDQLRHYWIDQNGPSRAERETIRRHIDGYTAAIARLLGVSESEFAIVDDATLDEYC